MAHASEGVGVTDGTIPVPAGSRTHGQDRRGHDHDHGAHGHHHHPAASEPARAAPRAYRHSMFLASALERLVIAVLLIGAIWVGILWAIG
jgi:hypothetical protein